MKKIVIYFLLGISLSVITPVNTTAATLNVVGGQLLGAYGVDVLGTLYDVSFQDGTCVALFGGCDEVVNDFVFTDFVSAVRATEALMAQVFLDTAAGAFDSLPALTNGVGSGNDPTTVMTVWNLDSRLPGRVSYTGTWNTVAEISDTLVASSRLVGDDTTGDLLNTYAVWSEAVVSVPVPPVLFIIVTGLSGLILVSRKRIAQL